MTFDYERGLIMDEQTAKKPPGKRNRILTLAFFAFLALAIFSSSQIFLGYRQYVVSDNEYDNLREMFEPPDIVAGIDPPPNGQPPG